MSSHYSTGTKARASSGGLPPGFPSQKGNRATRLRSPTGPISVPFRLGKKSLRGFSLVEVTLALGIITFGLIAVMGLLPTGIKLTKQSADEVAAVNIMTGISAKLQKAGSTASSGTDYFNADGVVTTLASATYAAKWVVRSSSVPPNALITVSWPAVSPTPTGFVESIVVITQP